MTRSATPPMIGSVSRSGVLSLTSNAAAARELFRILQLYRELLLTLAARDVRDRFAGHMLGPIWAVAHPALLMLVYALVFTFVFPARGLDVDGRPLDLTAYILSGLIPWLYAQEVLTRSPSAITGNASLVKQIVFPVEVLPLKMVLAALPAQLTATILLGLWLLVSERLEATVLLLPLALTLQVAFMAGCAFGLACLGAFVKDLREVVVVFCTVNLFLQPILYLPGQLPPAVRPLLWVNPFSHLTYIFQDSLYFGAVLHPWSWVVSTVLAGGSLAVGYRLFRVMKPRFGDAL